MQRVHVDDTIGRLKNKGIFEFLNLPAIAMQDDVIELSHGRKFIRKAGEALDPVREPIELLEKLREEITPRVFNAQYQQNPSASTDAIIRWNKFRRYPTDKKLLKIPNEDYYVISWDTAIKTGDRNDYSVGTVWFVETSHNPPGARHKEDSQCYLVDIVRAKLDFPHLVDRMCDLDRQYRPRDILIEDTHLGPALRSEVSRYTRTSVKLIAPVGDKTSRLYAQQGWIERGQVLLPQTADWLDAFKAEIEAFPHGAHDDQVDSFSQFLSWLSDVRGSMEVRFI